VAGDLAVLADFRVLLNLYKGPDLGAVADRAPVQVDEFGKPNIFAQFDVFGNA
jgi:hypothetical protein